MLQSFDRWGLFAFWTVIGVLSIFYILFFIPETSGVPLEDMDMLFEKRWWQIGMAANRPVPGDLEHSANRRQIPEVAQMSAVPASTAAGADVSDGNEKGKEQTGEKAEDSGADHLHTRTADAQ